MILLEKEKELFLHTYKRIPIDVDYGKGVFLFDKDGKKYLDFFSGLAVNALGYAHPRIVSAVSDQISKFAHLSNNYITKIQIDFTEKLLKYSGMSRAFLTNSGAEAVEGAIKIMRKISGPDKKIFSLTNSFHGRTYGALSLTARQKYRAGFEPLLQNTAQIKFNDINDLKKTVDGNTAAVFLELFQGEGGINIVSEEFINELSSLRDKFHFFIVLDEIQTGAGRTGKAFSYHHFNFNPDIVVAAKAIGGGLPLGAILTSKKFDDVFGYGNHGTTFGGNPVCCAAGIVVLEEVFEKGLLKNVQKTGNYLTDQLENLKSKLPSKIKEVRGKGLMVGVELFFDGVEVVNVMREKGILINCTNQNVIRLLPPLIITKENADNFISEFKNTLTELS